MGLDIRSGNELSQLDEVIESWKHKGICCRILFLDASDATLIKRYKETRRSHPLAGGGRVDRGIEKERDKLAFLKAKADYIIDTSNLLTREPVSYTHLGDVDEDHVRRFMEAVERDVME